MTGFVRLKTRKGGTVNKRFYAHEGKDQERAYNEVLRMKNLWDECAPDMFPDGLIVVDDASSKKPLKK